MTIKVCPVCSVSWYADKPEKHMMTCRDFKAMTDLIDRHTAQPAAAPQNITYASYNSGPGGRDTRSPCGNGDCCDAGRCLYPVEHGQPAAGLVEPGKDFMSALNRLTSHSDVAGHCLFGTTHQWDFEKDKCLKCGATYQWAIDR